MGLLFRTDWADVPHNNPHAKPVTFEIISGPKVIHVRKAFYRDASLEDVLFEISPTQRELQEYDAATSPDEVRVRVVCLWYGRFPIKDRFITIRVKGSYVLKEANRDEIVRDIASRLPNVDTNSEA